MSKYIFDPDYVVCPGETLKEYLETFNMSQAELSKCSGISEKVISEIINGKASISAETSLKFEKIFNRSASFWNNLENGYRDLLARLAEKQILQKKQNWSKKFPLKYLK